MPDVKCFLVEPTHLARAFLRCYISGSSCPGEHGYHNAMVPIGDLDGLIDPEGFLHSPRASDYASDGRWPEQCDCGWPFGSGPTLAWIEKAGRLDGIADDVEGRTWQVFVDRLWRNPESGVVGTLTDHGAGAMFDAFWMGASYAGPDGHHWSLILPPGRGNVDVWSMFGPASNGGGWEISGEAPMLTASPSIQSGSYHGFLRNGVLVDA